jgi:tight adherence protein B
VLCASDRLGTPAAPALRGLASEVRAEYRRAGTAWARTVPVRLLFPLVFLVLPSFLLLAVAPILLSALPR